jgi:uncharacterized Fe-S cluster-containing radical SAM superfamily protein
VNAIDTDAYSLRLRERAVNLGDQTLLISDLRGSGQEDDLSEPVNCGGVGRIRHFTRQAGAGWPSNPLPIEPAAKALGLDPAAEAIRAQVFQAAVCNWRCWWCYVPFGLLSGHPQRSRMFTAGELIDAYLATADRPPVLDLSGGQPDLVPEWVGWTLRELDEREVRDVFVWSDDNLSNDYFWTCLTSSERDYIVGHSRYARAACFKGYDAESFAFTTNAAPELFARQFSLFARLLATGMNLFAYATFTGPDASGMQARMRQFTDQLQDIAENLPLRVVPLHIDVWGPVGPRLNDARRQSLLVQQHAIQAWTSEIAARFSPADIARPITQVQLTPARTR